MTDSSLGPFSNAMEDMIRRSPLKGDQVLSSTKKTQAPSSRSTTPSALSPSKPFQLTSPIRQSTSAAKASPLLPFAVPSSITDDDLNRLLALACASSSSSPLQLPASTSQSITPDKSSSTSTLNDAAPGPSTTTAHRSPPPFTIMDYDNPATPPPDDSNFTPDQQRMMSDGFSNTALQTPGITGSIFDSPPSPSDQTLASLEALATEAATAVIITPPEPTTRSTYRQHEAASAARQLCLSQATGSTNCIKALVANIITNVITTNETSVISSTAVPQPHSTSTSQDDLSSLVKAADKQMSSPDLQQVMLGSGHTPCKEFTAKKTGIRAEMSSLEGIFSEADPGESDHNLDFLSSSAGTSISFTLPAQEAQADAGSPNQFDFASVDKLPMINISTTVSPAAGTTTTFITSPEHTQKTRISVIKPTQDVKADPVSPVALLPVHDSIMGPCTTGNPRAAAGNRSSSSSPTLDHTERIQCTPVTEYKGMFLCSPAALHNFSPSRMIDFCATDSPPSCTITNTVSTLEHNQSPPISFRLPAKEAQAQELSATDPSISSSPGHIQNTAITTSPTKLITSSMASDPSGQVATNFKATAPSPSKTATPAKHFETDDCWPRSPLGSCYNVSDEDDGSQQPEWLNGNAGTPAQLQLWTVPAAASGSAEPASTGRQQEDMSLPQQTAAALQAARHVLATLDADIDAALGVIDAILDDVISGVAVDAASVDSSERECADDEVGEPAADEQQEEEQTGYVRDMVAAISAGVVAASEASSLVAAAIEPTADRHQQEDWEAGQQEHVKAVVTAVFARVLSASQQEEYKATSVIADTPAEQQVVTPANNPAVLQAVATVFDNVRASAATAVSSEIEPASPAAKPADGTSLLHQPTPSTVVCHQALAEWGSAVKGLQMDGADAEVEVSAVLAPLAAAVKAGLLGDASAVVPAAGSAATVQKSAVLLDGAVEMAAAKTAEIEVAAPADKEPAMLADDAIEVAPGSAADMTLPLTPWLHGSMAPWLHSSIDAEVPAAAAAQPHARQPSHVTESSAVVDTLSFLRHIVSSTAQDAAAAAVLPGPPPSSHQSPEVQIRAKARQVVAPAQRWPMLAASAEAVGWVVGMGMSMFDIVMLAVLVLFVVAVKAVQFVSNDVVGGLLR